MALMVNSLRFELIACIAIMGRRQNILATVNAIFFSSPVFAFLPKGVVLGFCHFMFVLVIRLACQISKVLDL